MTGKFNHLSFDSFDADKIVLGAAVAVAAKAWQACVVRPCLPLPLDKDVHRRHTCCSVVFPTYNKELRNIVRFCCCLADIDTRKPIHYRSWPP